MDKLLSKIVNERIKKGISETKLAQKVGLTQKTLNNLLNGKTKRLDMELIAKLQTELGIVSELSESYSINDDDRPTDEVEKMILRKMRKRGKAYQFRWLATVEAEEEAELKNNPAP